MGVSLYFRPTLKVKEIEDKTDITIDNIEEYEQSKGRGRCHVHLGEEGTWGALSKDDDGDWKLTSIGGNDAILDQIIRNTGIKFIDDGAGFGWEYMAGLGKNPSEEDIQKGYDLSTEAHLKGIAPWDIEIPKL